MCRRTLAAIHVGGGIADVACHAGAPATTLRHYPYGW